MQKFVTSITAEFGEPVVVSSGAGDAGKIVALDENGKIDKSVLPMQAILPAGVVQYFARQTAPEGWLKADGLAISRTEYADLFAAAGTTFGEGDGSTTFNLPDLRGEFVRGLDDGRGVDVDRVFGSSQTDELKSHNHNARYTYPWTEGDTGIGIPSHGKDGLYGLFYTSSTGGTETST